jgi:predicted RNase H-like HicB family nuclease
MTHVVMLVHQENGWQGASFPDFPGCTAVEADMDALYAKAAEVLAWHAATMAADGEVLPRIRSLAELPGDPTFVEDSQDAALIGFVRVELPGKTARVT